ncbi:MAG: response regulator [Firmicutes bacterium]|nr:response regulator [Bacillota bacterium]
MFQVVIADDEVRVCRLVQMLVDWDALGMQVCGTASNGLEALELVKTLEPDILITDMRMPGLDGLELIEKAKQISPNLEIALISGYAQFEYAQTAMRYGVGGYLLKPIKRDILMATLEKLGAKCRERAASTAVLETLRNDSSKSRDLLRNRLPEDLLRGRFAALSWEKLRETYGFPVQNGVLQALILKIDYDPEQFQADHLEGLQDKVEEVFHSSVFSLCAASAFQFFGSAGYGVLNYDPEKTKQLRRSMRQSLDQMETQKAIYGLVEFSMAVGSAVSNPEALPLSMHEARVALTERLVEGTGQFLEIAPPPSELNAHAILDKYNRAVDRIIDTLSDEAADEGVDGLRAEAEKIPNVRGFELLNLVLAAGRMFSTRLHMNEEEALIRAFTERCELCGSADKLFACLRALIRQQVGSLRELRENEAIRPIRIAKQYIQQHFHEPITLEDVCAATGFSVSYFSTMFKRETGEGFSRYLTRIRVERAKELLQETAMPIADICVEVGYSDLKHFTGIFKKMTNLSPGQYRKLYG